LGRGRRPDPEVLAKGQRRQFGAEYKLKILEEAADGARRASDDSKERDALLKRENELAASIDRIASTMDVKIARASRQHVADRARTLEREQQDLEYRLSKLRYREHTTWNPQTSGATLRRCPGFGLEPVRRRVEAAVVVPQDEVHGAG
jgi:hypothetical protein